MKYWFDYSGVITISYITGYYALFFPLMDTLLQANLHDIFPQNNINTLSISLFLLLRQSAITLSPSLFTAVRTMIREPEIRVNTRNLIILLPNNLN